ncbi:hypothetical protein P5673_000240 [Acropora cervicornis]|uniref:Uncharacterized protein n=1 Tax=Acropora cervicornis TaxID=6130 RepID=A0AAD9R6S5_ACRCE|nr:hypothetical protein P5673_000240 [Acropora cervicornis]
MDTHYFLRHHHKDIEVLTVRSNSLYKNSTKHPNVRKLSFTLSSMEPAEMENMHFRCCSHEDEGELLTESA